MTKNSEPVQIYQIKITLKDIKPVIWRRVQVRSDITLAELHNVIQGVMGWTDSHLHEFVIDDKRFGPAGMDDGDFGDETADESSMQLNKIAAPKSRFAYHYDFGDDWRHELKLEKAIAFQSEIKTPRCVDGERSSPPEDCGGIWGFADLLEKLAGPPCDEQAELIDWLGREFDPQQFNLGEVNEMLTDLQK